jgi:hypothetical protein
MFPLHLLLPELGEEDDGDVTNVVEPAGKWMNRFNLGEDGRYGAAE